MYTLSYTQARDCACSIYTDESAFLSTSRHVDGLHHPAAFMAYFYTRHVMMIEFYIHLLLYNFFLSLFP